MNTKRFYIVFRREEEENGKQIDLTEENTSMTEIYKKLCLKGTNNNIIDFFYGYHQGCLHVFVEYEKKINIRSQEFFTLFIGEKEYKPQVRSGKRMFNIPETDIPFQKFHLHDIYHLKIFLKALTNRDDLTMILTLKEEPIYQTLIKPMDLSVFYVTSHIICSLYVEDAFQELRLHTIAKKLSELPYLCWDSDKKIRDSVENLSGNQLKIIFHILKGNM